MKTLNLLYKNNNSLINEIHDSDFGTGAGCVARIHIASSNKEEALSIAKEVKAALPKCDVMGLAVNAVIYMGKIYENEVLISINQFSNTEIISQVIFSEKDEHDEHMEVVKQITSLMEEEANYCAFMFFGGEKNNPSKVVESLRKNYPETTLIGGRAGFTDENNLVHSYIFNHENIYEKGLIISLIRKDYVLAYGSTVLGHAPLSEKFTVTQLDDSAVTIEKINNKDAMEFIIEQVNGIGLPDQVEIDDSLVTDLLLRFPIILEGQDEVSRYIRFNEDGAKVELYDVSIKVGQKFRFGFSSVHKVEKEWQEICDDLQTISAETIFCYASNFRFRKTKGLIEWELDIFNKTDISGAICIGTVGIKSGKSHFLNGNFSVFTLAEKESYLDINLQAFDSIDKVSTSLNDFYNYSFGQYSSTEESITPEVIKEALKKREVVNEVFSIEGYLSPKTMSEFLKQQSIERMSKICLISIKNYVEKNAIEIGYNRQLYVNLLSSVIEFISKEFSHLGFDLYNYDESSFFIVANKATKDSDFIELTQNLFSYLSGKNYSSELSNKCDFAVTISGEKVYELYEKISELDFKTSDSKYIISDSSVKDTDVLQNEFELVGSIKEIIKNKRVIPYFQGIYDNKVGKFYAYEALMRLQTSNGTMLFPGDFMEISKKYNLYLKLSSIMIANVLDIFKDRNEIITLNVSSLDICEVSFLNMIEEKLRNAKHPENFIFELVETEQYSHQREIKEFIRRIKKYGCKIAIDDFGSGYSNFIEIGNLDIDYIKINGSLTELLGTDTRYDQILDSIMYLSKKMEVELVAEMVETASMQKSIVAKGIRYSQGYFFSKPMSLEKLILVSNENKKTRNIEKDISKEKESSIFKIGENSKKQIKNIRLGGIFTILISIILISVFTVFIQGFTKDLSDEFLLELADNTSLKIKSELESSENSLLISKAAVSQCSENPSDMNAMLESLNENSGFDGIYISYDGRTLMDYNGTILNINVEDAQVNSTSDDGVETLSPILNEDTNKEMLLMRVPIDGDVGELYGLYDMEEYRKVLDIQSFGGDAFYHLCEIDGTPIVISGDENNLFKNGDMYDFIATLDIVNGYTTESIKKRIEDGGTVLLDYSIDGNNRTCVMIPIPGTNWCVVSIILNEAVVSTATTISLAMTIFTLTIVLVLFIYFFFTFKALAKNQRHLKDSLEASYFLANSLQDSVETDTLTRTYSRGTAIEKISIAIENAKEKKQLHGIIIFDVDDFKLINDSYGHGIGDLYLQEVVKAAKSCLRAGDIIGRLGGDEFIILLNNISAKDNVIKVLNRILENVREIKVKGTANLDASISAGVAVAPEHGETYEELVGIADKALYKAKEAGKNNYIVWDPTEE